ncbi:hypothetical protein F4821DRAFT_182010 [Hypoxylon rubiginosum]|uniref:Uncharacterized protein n=1 Tax=Hypoxylon rubiginosum TaxID=110542 RepID=A0ACC0CU11_9PEZI|nr:hypothetical protein F4821DRAFT_182010 [Hypoxylon rubiginosum]
MSSSEAPTPQPILDRLHLAMRGRPPTSLAEAICVPLADGPSVPDLSELLCYFVGSADITTTADVQEHVLDASIIRLAYGVYAEANRNRLSSFEGHHRPPLPSPDAAYFLAGLSEDDYPRELIEVYGDAVDWDAAHCVARIVRYLESPACAAVPWSPLKRPGPGQEEDDGLEDEARERYAIGIRIFTYLQYLAVKEAGGPDETVSKIEEWRADIPVQGYLDPQAWTAEEANEIADLEGRRRGTDLTRPERQQILLDAYRHWDEIAESRKAGTKKDFLQKLKGMFSRRR